jgi:ribosomal protein L37AE/L43A
LALENNREDLQPMNGAMIQEQTCPRCAIRRTVRIAGASFCHNCHMYWHGASHATFPPRPELAYVFTAQETARLVIYRAAIRAGFYNNW